MLDKAGYFWGGTLRGGGRLTSHDFWVKTEVQCPPKIVPFFYTKVPHVKLLDVAHSVLCIGWILLDFDQKSYPPKV